MVLGRGTLLTVGDEVVRGVLGALLVVSLTACGAQQAGPSASQPSSASPSSPTPAPTTSSEEDAALLLFVTNQSFEDESVRMVVRVDGATVADRDFAVEGQHTWVPYFLVLEPGRHVIEVASDSGSSVTTDVDLPEAPGKRWVVVSHWAEDGDSSIDVDVYDHPVGFA